MAFGSHNWDLKETVMPSQQQLNDVQDRLENVMGGGEGTEEVFSIVDNDIAGSDITITVEFSPPFGFPITIQDFFVGISRTGTSETLATLSIAQEDKGLEIEPSETGIIHLIGEYTGSGGELPSDAEISEGTLKVEVYDIEVTFSLEEMSGGGSESVGMDTSTEERKKEKEAG